jgi:TRAP-type C4-dicarboxylate transport system substrate-binding protein
MNWGAAARLLATDPVEFARRLPPALDWRWHKAWDPIARSDGRRALDGRVTWAARSVRPRREPRVLRFANAHLSLQPELEWFAEELHEVSGGGLQVRFVNTWTTADNPREETATVAAVASDRADLGWAGTRAFGCLGVRSLDPLQAPFLLEDYAALDAVCRDDVAIEMLEPLERLGLVGLVVLPGAQRKPFAFARRLLGPRDYEGAKLRIHESLVADSTYRALGAEAVTLSVKDMAGRADALIDGLDVQTEALAGWRLRGSITFNVNLWPRTIALVASSRTYEWLEPEEREMLHAASAGTLARALEHLADQERRDREALPPEVTAIYAEDADLKAMHERVESVREELRALPETGRFLERLEALVLDTERKRALGVPPRGDDP